MKISKEYQEDFRYAMNCYEYDFDITINDTDVFVDGKQTFLQAIIDRVEADDLAYIVCQMSESMKYGAKR